MGEGQEERILKKEKRNQRVQERRRVQKAKIKKSLGTIRKERMEIRIKTEIKKLKGNQRKTRKRRI